MIRFNPHWHCIVMEGGIDNNNDFCHTKVKDTSSLTEIFRRRVIKLFIDKELLNKKFAVQFSNWKNSGFSVDNSIFLFPHNDKARESLCQYIARHPASLKKITYVTSKKKVLYHTRYNEYWKENIKLFTTADFIAELTQHIPTKHKHLIRYYRLYSSRTKGKASQVGRYEKFGIKVNTADETALDDTMDYKEVSDKASKQAWARLIQKVYEIDPLVCPKCGSEMRIVAIIQNK